ncbi:MAG: lysophospholipid acyltransferase family protein [Saccharofermentanales bacterium]|jgi:1-acyl-sn-glycerol-3-phosphate acyltransferase
MSKRRKKPTELQSRGWQGRLVYAVGMFLSQLLIRLKYLGQENLPKEGAYIIAANHQTMFDGLWIMGGIPQEQLPRFSCIAGSDLEQHYGLTGRIMFRVGKAIPIDREGNPMRGLVLSKQQLEKGAVIMIHPEGTRTHDGRIGEMKNGVAYLARKAGVPIIPTYIDGGYEIFSRYMSVPHPIDWKRFRRKKMTIEFGEPIYPENYYNNAQLMDVLTTYFKEKERAALAKRDT